MIGDGFTFEAYESLLRAGRAAGYEYLTVRDYLASESLPEEFVILRHDVDRKPENALSMAQLEAEYGIPSTYYFRTVPGTFDPPLIRRIEDLGHEIGYHYEDVDRADGDRARAHDIFRANLAKLDAVCENVDTVCMHGNPLTAHDNRDMWRDEAELESYDLLGEAYLSMDFADVSYFSDTGRTWRDGVLKVKDTTRGADGKRVQVDTTDELIELLRENRVPRVCLLAHPNRWARNYQELVSETAKDATINVGKRALQRFR
jgi:peptidoglycan/xylan/chitin deacetylase (PgdA/CDA1 family)